MSYIVVPKECRAHHADVWLASDEPPQADGVLIHPGGSRPVLRADWQAWPTDGGPRRLFHQSVRIDGLPARTSGDLRLEIQGQERACGRLTTLPERVPTAGEQPLTFLLGSCYYRQNDRGRVERVYRDVPATHRPDFKILCGDQVYLDQPTSDFLRYTHGKRGMQLRFFAHYWRVWSDCSALWELLADGANFFSPDDHELWNNAPNRAWLVRDSLTGTGRDRWLEVAKELYALFQTDQPITQFEIPPLSFLVADTRLDRDAREERFMKDTEFKKLCSWLEGLQGPGVLVLGQPVFASRQRFAGHFFDWGLADYDQYKELVPRLQNVSHSLLVLTGDVHFRRCAWASTRRGAHLVELISSPLALVHDAVGGSWKPAPDSFPSKMSGTKIRVVTSSWKGAENHFLILQCIARGKAVEFSVYDIDCSPGAQPDVSQPALRIRLR